jgi:hypothetical protein
VRPASAFFFLRGIQQRYALRVQLRGERNLGKLLQIASRALSLFQTPDGVGDLFKPSNVGQQLQILIGGKANQVRIPTRDGGERPDIAAHPGLQGVFHADKILLDHQVMEAEFGMQRVIERVGEQRSVMIVVAFADQHELGMGDLFQEEIAAGSGQAKVRKGDVAAGLLHQFRNVRRRRLLLRRRWVVHALGGPARRNLRDRPLACQAGTEQSKRCLVKHAVHPRLRISCVCSV